MKITDQSCYLLILILVLGSFFSLYAEDKKSETLDEIAVSSNGDYVIDKDIDLKGKILQVPDCDRIVVVGKGRLSNGILAIGTSTYEIDGGWGIFNNIKIKANTSISNTNKCALPEINARWFCTSSGENTDNTKGLQAAIDAAHSLCIPVYLPRGYYKVTSSLSLYEGDILKGEFAGTITPNHQKGASFIRYSGRGDSMIKIKGQYVTIQNILLSASNPFLYNGITLEGDAGLHFNLDNVLICNSKYGIACVLGKNAGFSECIWNRVRIWNCVRGVSIDITSDSGQYATYNNFYNFVISSAKEKGFYIHCRAINSCSFRDCLIESIGYAGSYDEKYVNSSIYAIEAINDGVQGSITIDGGYFENTFYSKSNGQLVKGYNYSNNAVFSVNNISLSIMNTRFANTRTVVKSNGQDVINILNCIDNGYLGIEQSDVSVCKTNVNTIVDVNGYSFANKNKEIVNGKNQPSKQGITTRNVRKKDGTIEVKHINNY